MFQFSSSMLARLSKDGHYTHKQCRQACMVLYGNIYNLFGHREPDCARNKTKELERGLYICKMTDLQISDYLRYISEQVKVKSCWIH